MSERVGCSAYLARSSRSTHTHTHTHTHRVSIFPSLRQCLVATAVTVSEILQLYHLLPSPPPLLSLRPIKLTRVSAYTSERRYFSSQVPPTYQSQLYLPLLPIVFVPLLCVCHCCLNSLCSLLLIAKNLVQFGRNRTEKSSLPKRCAPF